MSTRFPEAVRQHTLLRGLRQVFKGARLTHEVISRLLWVLPVVVEGLVSRIEALRIDAWSIVARRCVDQGAATSYELLVRATKSIGATSLLTTYHIAELAG